jgi:hypothetical protein
MGYKLGLLNMAHTKKLSRLSIDLTPEQHQQIKLMATLEKISIKQLIINSILKNKKVKKDYDKALSQSIKEFERGEYETYTFDEFRKIVADIVQEK